MQKINNEKPDIIAIRELFNDECKYIIDVDTFPNFRNRVCGRPPTSPDFQRQISRLLGLKGYRYDYHCSQKRDASESRRVVNGYECVAIRASLLEFAAPEFSIPTIQPPCVDGGDSNPLVNYKGGDTGWQVERIRLKQAVGPLADTTFDLVNGHLIDPTDILQYA